MSGVVWSFEVFWISGVEGSRRRAHSGSEGVDLRPRILRPARACSYAFQYLPNSPPPLPKP